MQDFSEPREVVICVNSYAQLVAVYALLGGVSTAAASPPAAAAVEASANAAAASPPAADEADGTVDAHGWPWSEDLHASTKGQTKEGLWRMKVGVARPDPKPGFPKTDGTGTATNGEESKPSDTAANANAGAADEDDEFAAFRAAAAASDEKDANAKANVPARKWTDADLGALCNQAAGKLGDPDPIKAIIAKFVPEGEVSHSRNIPDDKRAEFAAAVEEKAGIEFAG